LAGGFADVFFVVMQCVDERGDSAWVAQHTENLRGEFAGIVVAE